jgi:hypothetical protein
MKPYVRNLFIAGGLAAALGAAGALAQERGPGAEPGFHAAHGRHQGGGERWLRRLDPPTRSATRCSGSITSRRR